MLIITTNVIFKYKMSYKHYNWVVIRINKTQIRDEIDEKDIKNQMID